MNITRTQ